jgi:hypothetical protein
MALIDEQRNPSKNQLIFSPYNFIITFPCVKTRVENGVNFINSTIRNGFIQIKTDKTRVLVTINPNPKLILPIN